MWKHGGPDAPTTSPPRHQGGTAASSSLTYRPGGLLCPLFLLPPGDRCPTPSHTNIIRRSTLRCPPPAFTSVLNQVQSPSFTNVIRRSALRYPPPAFTSVLNHLSLPHTSRHVLLIHQLYPELNDFIKNVQAAFQDLLSHTRIQRWGFKSKFKMAFNILVLEIQERNDMWKHFEIERFSIPHQFPVSKPQFQVCNRAKLAIFKLFKYCLRFRENPLFDNPDSLCAPVRFQQP